MATSRFGFAALLKKVNPDESRLDLAKKLPGEVREWLKDHEYETRSPHSRLIGSYGRQTAVTDIKDVDTLFFIPDAARDREPESVLRELKSVLDEYPDSSAETSSQRRSIKLSFSLHELDMDIVVAVADDGIEKPLWIPDRQKKEWVRSDPLGYARALSDANGNHGGKLVPLIKLIKAWRNEQMVNRRPKSYLLEVIVYQAVTSGCVTLKGKATSENVCDFFEHIEEKWAELMDEGDGVPRVTDPQLGNVISSGWDRAHFETFMRRIGESARAARRALDAENDDEAHDEWAKVFGKLWPTRDEVKEEARAAAAAATPGKAYVSPSGTVSSTASAGAILSRPTTFHGGGQT